METNIIKMISIADIVSLFNALSGLMAMIYAIDGNFMLAAKLLILAVIFDSLDGIIARKTKQDTSNTIFGENIDSLSDVISFGVAPAIILYIMTKSYLTMIPVILLVLGGVLRLTRYNTITFNKHEHSNSFIGLPIPTSSLVLGTLILSSMINADVLVIIMTIIALLMITQFEYPKISNKIILTIMGIFAIICLLPDIVNLTLYNIPSLALFCLTIIYVLGIPILIIISTYRNRDVDKKPPNLGNV